jgi:hypothetical protein
MKKKIKVDFQKKKKRLLEPPLHLHYAVNINGDNIWKVDYLDNTLAIM